MTFIKWVGCKSQLSNLIINKIKEVDYVRYYEPFVGSGSILFKLSPNRTIISDVNWELINCYLQIKNNVKELIRRLEIHFKNHNKNYYISIRKLDRTNEYSKISDIHKASRIIYLITTCYNGLYRVNKSGQFNTPIGTNQKYDYNRLIKSSEYLNNNKIIIRTCSFEEAMIMGFDKDLYYLDPPYDSSDNTVYNQYTIRRFDRYNQLALKSMCDYLHSRNCYFLLSNSNTSFIKSLYNQYSIKEVITNRKISSKTSSRGNVSELLISNY